MMARKSRIGSIQDIISSVTMWPWEEIRAPAKKHPSSIETSNSSVICQGITENLLLFPLAPSDLYTISQWNSKTVHYTECRKLLCLYASSTTNRIQRISAFLQYCIYTKDSENQFPLHVISFPTKTKINFLIYAVILCVTLKDSIWFHKNEKDHNSFGVRIA